ncbi:hypothetical protein EON82_16615 [bacterium]|nr:MAG: hypothetical protein EON82_16615 [bacterium]
MSYTVGADRRHAFPMQPICLLSALLVASPAPRVAPDIAIVGARIEVGDGRVIDNGTIVVRGDRIAAVGAGLAAPSGATVIDGKGLTVYPGFIDAYSTSGLKLPEPVPSGKDQPDTLNTAPATMWHENRKNIRADVRAAKCLDLKGPFTDRYKEGITSVLLSGGNGSLAGTAALVDLAAEPKVLNDQAAGEIVLRSAGGFRGGEHVHDHDNEDMAGGQRPQGAQQPTGYQYPGTLFGIVGLTRQTLADAQYYAAQSSPKADPVYDGLKPLVTGQIPGLFTVSNARDISRAANVSKEFGFPMIVNGTTDGYRMIDLLKARQAPVILSPELADEPTRKMSDDVDATPQRVLDARWELWKERQGNARMLNEAGITLAFRNPSLENVRKVIAAGLPREAALKALTVNPAAMYGVSNRLGTVEAGKLANLVIMTGDFADAKSTVKTVLVEGTAFDAEKKETAK